MLAGGPLQGHALEQQRQSCTLHEHKNCYKQRGQVTGPPTEFEILKRPTDRGTLLFYGAAFSDAEAEAALAAAAIEAFSYCKPNDGTGVCGPDPENTFIFGFAGIGGRVIIPTAPSAWIGALAGVLLLIGFHLLRRRAASY